MCQDLCCPQKCCVCLCVGFDETVSVFLRICLACTDGAERQSLSVTVWMHFFSLFVIFHLAANLTFSLAVSVCLQAALEDRLKLLHEAHRDFGPSSQHFLSSKSKHMNKCTLSCQLYFTGLQCCLQSECYFTPEKTSYMSSQWLVLV